MIVIRRSANMLIRYVISEEALPDSVSARRLLSIIKQRHPTGFNDAVDAIREEDEGVEVSLEQLIISLSMVKFIQID
jgi:U3 small nucleolar RNA-associated protein 10